MNMISSDLVQNGSKAVYPSSITQVQAMPDSDEILMKNIIFSKVINFDSKLSKR